MVLAVDTFMGQTSIKVFITAIKTATEGGLFNRNKGYQLNVKTGDIKSDFSRE